MPDQHVLYRFVDGIGQLLYVGVTKNPAARFRRHGYDATWWEQVSTIYLERYATRRFLLLAEREAIENEFPMYNRMGSTGKSAEKNFGILPCPACGRDSFYRREMDRYYHVWGVSNLECWEKCSRGEIRVPTTNIFGRPLTRRTWPLSLEEALSDA